MLTHQTLVLLPLLVLLHLALQLVHIVSSQSPLVLSLPPLIHLIHLHFLPDPLRHSLLLNLLQSLPLLLLQYLPPQHLIIVLLGPQVVHVLHLQHLLLLGSPLLHRPQSLGFIQFAQTIYISASHEVSQLRGLNIVEFLVPLHFIEEVLSLFVFPGLLHQTIVHVLLLQLLLLILLLQFPLLLL